MAIRSGPSASPPTLGTADAPEKLCAEIDRRDLIVDILVNNAGYRRPWPPIRRSPGPCMRSFSGHGHGAVRTCALPAAENARARVWPHHQRRLPCRPDSRIGGAHADMPPRKHF